VPPPRAADDSPAEQGDRRRQVSPSVARENGGIPRFLRKGDTATQHKRKIARARRKAVSRIMPELEQNPNM